MGIRFHYQEILSLNSNLWLCKLKALFRINVSSFCCCQEIADTLSKNFEDLEEVRHLVVDQELIDWKRKQQLAGNGAPFDPNLLENLQKWQIYFLLYSSYLKKIHNVIGGIFNSRSIWWASISGWLLKKIIK